MKSKFLFPTWCAMVGYLLAIPGFILGYLSIIKKYEIPGFGFKMRDHDSLFSQSFENFTNELATFLVIVGLVLIVFSKSKKEDELSAKLRLNSLYWSVMIYYVVYIIGLLFSIGIKEIPFVGDHISELNLFTPLVIFILRYTYLMHRNKEQYLIGHPRFLANQPFKIIGILLSTIGIAGLLYYIIVDPLLLNKPNWSSLAYLSLVIGLLLWSFSRNKIEDEMMMQQRLENLQLAVYFNYFLILVATLLVYSFEYLLVLMFAQFSILLFFVIRMEYINYKNNRMLNQRQGELSYEK